MSPNNNVPPLAAPQPAKSHHHHTTRIPILPQQQQPQPEEKHRRHSRHPSRDWRRHRLAHIQSSPRRLHGHRNHGRPMGPLHPRPRDRRPLTRLPPPLSHHPAILSAVCHSAGGTLPPSRLRGPHPQQTHATPGVSHQRLLPRLHLLLLPQPRSHPPHSPQPLHLIYGR